MKPLFYISPGQLCLIDDPPGPGGTYLPVRNEAAGNFTFPVYAGETTPTPPEPGYNEIPEMTDPLGKHWNQPADIRLAPMDDTHVILTNWQMGSLHRYDTSMPSGVYPGKCWLQTRGKVTRLVWYGNDPDPAFCSNNYRVVLTP